jgi:hypothetical protein
MCVRSLWIPINGRSKVCDNQTVRCGKKYSDFSEATYYFVSAANVPGGESHILVLDGFNVESNCRYCCYHSSQLHLIQNCRLARRIQTCTWSSKKTFCVKYGARCCYLTSETRIRRNFIHIIE